MAAMRRFLIALLLLAALGQTAEANDEESLWKALASGGHVALMRHAMAPGYGDPANFMIGDCSTQRTLSDEGRAQAKRMGDAFRANGVTGVKVFSSQWCRCQETATLLGLGSVEPLPALNSLHGRRHLAEAQGAALRDFLKSQPPDGPSLVLVSHHATIAHFTGEGTASGAVVVAKPDGAGGLIAIGALPAR